MKNLSSERREWMIRTYSRHTITLASVFILFVFAGVCKAQAQESALLRIKGVVVDTNDPPTPIAGVAVLIKGTTKGVSTDSDGFFSIEAARNDILEFTFLGYQSTEHRVTKSVVSLNIAMKEETNLLNEVVVVGITKQQRTQIASAVGSVDVKNFTSKPITRLSQALQGGTTGILVTQGSGLPGGDAASIKIRGVASLLGSDPLVLVDGVEFDMDKIDPATVENITVLKDAAAASMYGTRAANGVILVTTKRGQVGKLDISYNGYYGIQNLLNKPDFVDAASYMEMVRTAQLGEGSTSPTYSLDDIRITREGTDPIRFPSTNWYDHIMRSHSSIQEHAVSASGGSMTTRFAISAQYQKQDAIVRHKDSGFQRYNVRANTTTNLTKRLMVYMDLFACREEQTEPFQGTSGILDRMYRAFPTLNAKFPAVEGFHEPLYGLFNENNNPLMLLEQGGRIKKIRDEMFVNVRPSWNINDEFSVKAQFGYRLAGGTNLKDRESFLIYDYFNLENTPLELTTSKSVEFSTRLSYYTLGGSLEYVKEIKDHRITAIVGYAQELETRVTSSRADDRALRSYYGKVYYSWKNKYLFEAGIRRDGSSIFGPGQKWGNFPSVAVGWNIEKEAFMRNFKFLDQFKIRASWGKLGNNKIDPYQYQANINASNGVELVSANPAITWEKVTILDVGADISLFGQKLDITFDWFKKYVDDLIIDVLPTMSSGLLQMPANVGRAEVQGFELGVGFNHNFNENVSLGLNVGYSYNKSKWIEVTNDQIVKGINVHKKGYAIKEYYGYVTDGLLTQEDLDDRLPLLGGYDKSGNPNSQQPGDIHYVDTNGDGEVTDADRVPLGSIDPTSTYYANLTFRYKNLDFEAMANGVGNVCVMYGTAMRQSLNITQGATPQQINSDYWTANNLGAKYPRLTTVPGNNSLVSDFWRINGAFLRVKYLQIGYTSPWLAKKIRLQRVRFYVNVQNPFTFTKVKLIDPETKGDQTTHPLFRTFSVGLNLNF